MIEIIKKILGIGPKVDLQQIIANGAVIIDVRSKDEFRSGALKGSVNIPLNVIGNHISKIKKDKAVITCCASGARSAVAKRILKSNGIAEVYNGGSWTNLRKYQK